jgi:hypothetical protein
MARGGRPEAVRLPPDQVAATDRLIDAVRIGLGLRDGEGSPPLEKSVVQLARWHGVRAEVARAAHVVGASDEAGAVLARAARFDARHTLTARWETRRLVEAFGGRGIATAILKGVALSAQTGRDATDRPGTDIDLLVRPEQWMSAHECLLEAGYQLNPRTPQPRRDLCTRYVSWCYYEAPYQNGVATVDLHWRVTPGHCPPIAAPRLLDRRVMVEIDGTPMPTLHPDDALVQTLINGAKDGWTRLRSVIDAHLLVDRADADWDRAAALLSRSRIVAVGRSGVRHLGHPDRSLAEASPTSGSALHEWMSGVVQRPHDDEPEGTFGAYLDRVRHRAGLTPSATSTAAVVAGMVVSPDMIVATKQPRRWWPLISHSRPFRSGRRVALDARGMSGDD